MAKILIAEDNPDSLQLVEALMRSLGHDYESARDGEEAIAVYNNARRRGDKFDLLLLDAMMPRRTGYEVAWHVRRVDHETPIVIMTGLVDPLTVPHADYVKANDILPKPFDAEHLSAKLSCHLKRSARAAN